MSLVEDILDVLHMVLEYFGVSPDMLVPVWDSQLCGQYRSIVRMVGTNLPLKPTPRVHFEIPLVTYRAHGHVEISDAPAIPSLADVMWVFDDEGDSFAKTRNHLPPKKSSINRDLRRYPRPAPSQSRGAGASDPEALKKISLLESELVKLRAQIAMIVTAVPPSAQIDCQDAPGSPLTSPPPPPALTSTPRCAPPPPPPPPPCQNTPTETSSVFEMIRQRKKTGADKGPVRGQNSELCRGSENKGIPSMLDVLKDLNQVKLRSVERSPGGTPVRRRRSKGGAALLNDPAALIAEALKRKFAQHRHNSSSDKENSIEFSPFSSPEAPQVSVHTRRSQGRRHF